VALGPRTVLAHSGLLGRAVRALRTPAVLVLLPRLAFARLPALAPLARSAVTLLARPLTVPASTALLALAAALSALLTSGALLPVSTALASATLLALSLARPLMTRPLMLALLVARLLALALLSTAPAALARLVDARLALALLASTLLAVPVPSTSLLSVLVPSAGLLGAASGLLAAALGLPVGLLLAATSSLSASASRLVSTTGRVSFPLLSLALLGPLLAPRLLSTLRPIVVGLSCHNRSSVESHHRTSLMCTGRSLTATPSGVGSGGPTQVGTLKANGAHLSTMNPRDLSGHTVYQAGRGVEEVARELGLDPDDLVKLASNENPFGPSPDAVAAIRDAAESANSYPKASHTDLVEKLADRWDVAPAQVWLANGGDGVLDYLSRAMLAPGDPVLVPDPGFAYYGMSARYHHGEVREYRVSKADDFALTAETVLGDYDGERVVYLTSPHNPTGKRFDLDAIEAIAEGTDPETLVVVDEAYGEFADAPSAVELVDEREDVALVRTFSKVYGLAGVRLGYGIVPEAWADAYARVNTPFAASEVACRAGLAALDDDDHARKTVETAAWAREYVSENLDAPTWESHGNFVLAEVGDASAVADELQRRGVIVRDCTSFGLPECVRITCGTEAETERAVAELNEVLAS